MGNVHDAQLSRVRLFIDPGWDAGAFNPAGDVIALSTSEGDSTVTFEAVPSPACELAGACLRFPPRQLAARGTLLAWEP